MDVMPVWVRIQGLPIHMWNMSSFMNIKNILGKFLGEDYAYEETKDWSEERVLVRMDLR